jgi:O-antigen biosynthesis protein
LHYPSASQYRFKDGFYSRVTTTTDQQRIEGSQAIDTGSLRTSAKTGPLNVLAIHEMLPHPDRHGADLQWVQMLQELRAQGHTVTHIARSGVNRERYGPPLEALGIRVLTPDAERLRFLGFDFPATWTLERVLKENNFDLAILFHWFWNGISIPEHYMEDIRRFSPDTFVAVLTDDQQGLRELQLANLTHYWADYERSQDFASREMEVYGRADVLLTISEDDRRAFLRANPDLRTGPMPMIASNGPEGLPFHLRADVLFLANFDNPANRDAIDWMLSEIWPPIRRLMPAVQLVLVGNSLPPQLGLNQPGVCRVGYVADLSETFGACRIAASPVRFGTGIKTKNLLALAHGVPLVTTTVGADGLNLRDGHTALIANSAQEFSTAIVKAYGDESLWDKLSREGRGLITRNFSQERMSEAVCCVVEQARALRPKPFQPFFQWSYRIVENRFPEVLTGEPATRRNDVRIARYLVLAEDFLQEGRPADALAQLRHIISMMKGRIPANGPHLRAVELLSRAYRALSESSKALDYQNRSNRHIWTKTDSNRSLAKSNTSKVSAANIHPPAFSVIIPTYNRQATLRACLEALNRQTLPPIDFEVIVVDDGSTDSTEVFCRSYQSPFVFRYMRQLNAGAGAARRRAAQHARGDFLLFLNDDSIACPDLLAIHRSGHENSSQERVAILGNFQFPARASDHALTRFLSTSPFFFPQTTLKPGKYWEYTYFVTCNLSVVREAVLAVGSFDPQFRVAEDSDLGLRLGRKGFCVTYVPEACAVHHHLPFTVRDLIHRAEAYGQTHLALLRKHPSLLGDGRSFFGMLDETAAETWRKLTNTRETEIDATVKQLERIDSLDFTPFLTMTTGERTAAEEIEKLFRRAVPDVYWYYFFSSLLDTWNQEAVHPSMRALQSAVDFEEAYI